MRACCFTFSATDAVHAVGIFPDGDVEVAVFLAEAAAHAFFVVDFYAV